jgi:hypothetical protein
MKAVTFGPEGNFGPIARFVASFGEFCTEREQKNVCKFKVFLQLLPFIFHLDAFW